MRSCAGRLSASLWISDLADVVSAYPSHSTTWRHGSGRFIPASHPRLTDWVEAHIGETLNFYRLARQHHKHLKSTNVLERLNEEIKRRTRVARIFPNPDSCLRLVRALCAETHEGWLKDHRYLNMEYLKEQRKELMQAAAWPRRDWPQP